LPEREVSSHHPLLFAAVGGEIDLATALVTLFREGLPEYKQDLHAIISQDTLLKRCTIETLKRTGTW